MKHIVREELRTLANSRGYPCVSIYLPTHRTGQENQQDPIRFKNLCRQAKDKLLASGMRGVDARKFLQPLMDMLENPDVWRNPGDGLAVFRSEEVMQTYRLPMAISQTVAVADHFHLGPLLPLFGDIGVFNILALDLNRTILYQCTRDNIVPVDLTGCPTSLRESMKYDVLDDSQRFHTVASTSGKLMGIASGQGTSATDETVHKKTIVQFFLPLDRVVNRLLVHGGQNSPLLLAGVRYLCAMYREVNSYSHLLDLEIPGSTVIVSPKQLHLQAMDVFKSYRQQAVDLALSRYNRMAGSPLVSSDLRQIVMAACDGQVQTLLVPSGARIWGAYDPVTHTVTIHDKPENGEEDLLDLAALHTLMHGGETYVVPPNVRMVGHRATAILRAPVAAVAQ
jgi:hypothetical protein